MSASERREATCVCRFLRTKTAFGTLTTDSNLEPAPWTSGASTTAVYWCLATMQSSGPDDGFAHPHSCCDGRRCFEAPFE